MRVFPLLLATSASATLFLNVDEIQNKDGYTVDLPGHALAPPSIKAANQADASPILGCTTSSFSIPSWFVHNLTYFRDDDSLGFVVTNRATNYTAEIACGNATSSVSDASKPNVYAHCDVQNDPTADDKALLALVRVTKKDDNMSADLLLRQSWTCSDRTTTAPIKFSAAGESTAPLQCVTGADDKKTVQCVGAFDPSPPLLVRGNLESPVAIHPAPADGPIGHAKQGCSAAATKPPSWALQSVYYLNQTGDNGTTALSSQTLMLQVINHAIGYQAGCTGFLSDDLSTKPVSFSCSGQGYDFIGKDRYRISTQALFEPATFRFTVNQTWYCDDVDAGKPVSITASGSVVMPLNCTSVPVAGGGNKTTCLSTSDIIVQADKPGVSTPLPAYSITDPLPTPDGCTVSSIVNPAWTLSSFEIDGVDNKGNWTLSGSAHDNTTDVGFDLQFATGTNEFTYPVSVYQGKAVDGKPDWFHCKFGADQVPLAPYNCTYTYDAASKQLTLAADWICSDLDKEHPVLFTGTTTTTVTKPLGCTVYGGRMQCLTDEAATWTAPIANVTWRAAYKNVLAPS